MKVLKFGGSSVANASRIRNVLQILKRYYSEGERFTVVFSAFGGHTDLLIRMSRLAEKGDEAWKEAFGQLRQRHFDAAAELLDEPLRSEIWPQLEHSHEVLRNLLHGIFLVREASPRTMDYVLSFGERTSAFIITHALRSEGVPAAYLDARRIIKTDKHFGAARVLEELTCSLIREHYAQHPEIQVVTGFIGATKGGLTTTLGRGGSDYTAALLAAGLDASLIEIWTDVDGVLTADPRKVKKAFTIPALTYNEAMEMSHFGAKVIYPPTIQPALKKDIPIVIKNTFNPDFPGTRIAREVPPSPRAVKGISSISDIALLTLSGSGMVGVPGTAARLFGALAQAGINVILITQGSSEQSISFAVQPSDARKAKRRVEKEFAFELEKGAIEGVRLEENLAVVAIIGENMRYRPGIAGRLFQALGKNGINAVAIAQGSSELNISVVINREDESKALNALHEAFFLSDTKELHLFLVGVGLIGSTLLRQIEQQADWLREKSGLEIKITGLANSKKMLFDPEGIAPSEWKKRLDTEGEPMSMARFVAQMKALNLSNSIFVDNTASEKVASFYESILDASISISTPNKIATSSSYLQYQRLKQIAAKRGVPFMYETNVGAGLPVISTLTDLIQSGDRILKIEGILSGSLSFIFNNFKEGTRFSQIVREARKRGYTEPDPRTDLNGIDVRRKIIILARETGLPLEQKDVEIEYILPEEVRNAASVEEFFQALEAADAHFDQLRQEAAAEGKVLRFAAVLENGRAAIRLLRAGPEHPFYNLSGSDNMIVFTTERYSERPLVVRGPGAGAEVTAAGVFAEIIRIGNFLS